MMIELRPVLLVVGVLLSTLGCAMILPTMYDIVNGNKDWQAFAAAATLTLFVGTGMAFANRRETENFSVRQGFLMVTASWLAVSAFGALPFAWSYLDISYTDAFFESMSGLTTTGSTILTELDKAPPGILLWRGLEQWLGGLGIVVMAISVFPMLQVGGMQLFKIEAFDTEGRVLPRAHQIAGALMAIYLVITSACAASYYIAGMTLFDAIVHAMTTVATGGFSTHDASIAYFSNKWIDSIAILFMICGSLPFLLYVKSLRVSKWALVTDSQVRWFFGTILLFSILAWLSYQTSTAEPVSGRLITVIFSVVSTMTGTGFTTTAYDNWSSMAMVVFFILMFVGGCSGSTSCGIKIFRFQVMFEMIRRRLQSIIYPNGVFIERYNGIRISRRVMSSVVAVFSLYLMTFAAIAALLNVEGLDPVTAMSASATAVSNVGPGLGPIVGPVGNFAALSDFEKWTLSAGMLLGRLEILTALVLFTPAYWRR